MAFQLLIGDARESLMSLGENVIHTVMTSPPYWALRDYATGDAKKCEIGNEPTVVEYLANLLEVFRAVRRVLRDDGMVIVNLGDTYSKDAKRSGLAPGNQCLVPHRFAIAMQDDGWILRDTVIWHKRSPMPSSQNGVRWERCRVLLKPGVPANVSAPDTYAGQSHSGMHDANKYSIRGVWFGAPEWSPCTGCAKCEKTGGYILRRGQVRTTTAHEYLFFFAKTPKYFGDMASWREDAVYGANGSALNSGKTAHGKHNLGTMPRDDLDKRSPRSVWSLSAEPSKIRHFAMFPTSLVLKGLRPFVSPGGCCGACGAQYAPIESRERIPTRPANDPKAWKHHTSGDKLQQRGSSAPNLDPERHVTKVRTEGYLPQCQCQAATDTPIVLDPFAGSGTVGMVAQYLGAYFVGCELSHEYAAAAKERLQTPWQPKKAKKKRRRNGAQTLPNHSRQTFLFER